MPPYNGGGPSGRLWRRSGVLYELRGIQQQFGAAIVLDIASLSIEEGVVTALLGRNGAGKTTLLRLLAGLDSSSRGDLQFNGRSLRAGEAQADLRHRVTFVHQHPYLFHASVQANVAYGLKQRGVRGADLQRRVATALAMVKLDGFGSRRAQTLSAGEAQRAAIARALVIQPQVLLLDEPTAHADSQSFAIVTQVIRHAGSQGTTVILASHDDDLLASLPAQRISMVDGRVESIERYDQPA